MDESCCAVFHDAVDGDNLKELSLFLFIGSHSDLFRCTRHSAMKMLHCSIPMVSTCRKLVTAVGPAIFLVSGTIRSCYSSIKVLLRS